MDSAVIAEAFPELEEEKREHLMLLLKGKAVRRHICHIWSTEKGLEVFSGEIEKLKKAGKKYRVAC